MARGVPALWSVLFGLPLLAGGVALHTSNQYLQSFGRPVAALGGFVIIIGLIVQLITPEPPVFQDDENIIDSKNPNQRPTILKATLGIPLFLTASYLLYFTKLPYVYPTIFFFTGLFLYSSGLLGYWRNALTTYYLTDRRLISVYRFLTLNRKEIALPNIQMIQERKSVWEKLVGLGNVRVAAGVADLEIVANNIRDPTAFADQIRTRSN